MGRITDVILLCEDRQHEAFARRLLKEFGVEKRRVRVKPAPKGRGSGEQWVRQNYVQEVKALRNKNYIQGVALLIIIDEDTTSTKARQVTLAESLTQAGLTPREDDEAIIHLIPARNIETWIAYLGGEDIDETQPYPKLQQQRDCEPHIKQLKQMCDDRALRRPAPASLEQACLEFRARWRASSSP